MEEYGEAINKSIKDNGLENYKIILELGRSIVGNAGYLLTKVEYIKEDSQKNYVIVDHGFYFNENYRLISVYTNLSNIPESLVIGSEVNYLTELGIINNDGFDILSLTLLNNEEGKLVAQDDIINIEFIEKEYVIDCTILKLYSITINTDKTIVVSEDGSVLTHTPVELIGLYSFENNDTTNDQIIENL